MTKYIIPSITETIAIGIDHIAIPSTSTGTGLPSFITLTPCSVSVLTIRSVPEAPRKQFCPKKFPKFSTPAQSPLMSSSTSSLSSPYFATAAPLDIGCIRGLINCICPPIRSDVAAANTRIAR